MDEESKKFTIGCRQLLLKEVIVNYTYLKWASIIAFIIAFPIIGLFIFIGLVMFMAGGK